MAEEAILSEIKIYPIKSVAGIQVNKSELTPLGLLNDRSVMLVDGCEAYAEDNWKRIRIGELEFEAVKMCSRCILTTVNPKTGKKSPDGQPLRTLSQYRKGEGGVFFGMNLIPRSKGGLKLDDKIEIIC